MAAVTGIALTCSCAGVWQHDQGNRTTPLLHRHRAPHRRRRRHEPHLREPSVQSGKKEISAIVLSKMKEIADACLGTFNTTIRIEELNMDLFRKCMESVEECLRDAKMDESNVDEFVLVGGTKMDKSKEEIEKVRQADKYKAEEHRKKVDTMRH